MVQPAAGLPNIAFSSQSVHSGSRQMIGSAPDPHQLRLHSQRAYEHQQVQQQFPVADWSAAASCASPTAKGLSL
jgi:hypothetical protein